MESEKHTFFNKHLYWIILSSFFLLLMGTPGFLIWFLQQKFDLGNKPPDQVFTRIFRLPVPAGIYDIKVVGEAHMSGVFWMRFQTRNLDAVISALQRNPQVPVEGPKAPPPRTDLVSLREAVFYEDRYAAVGWDQAFLIKKPEYFDFYTTPRGTGWWGMLIVDRPQGIVYAYGELL